MTSAEKSSGVSVGRSHSAPRFRSSVTTAGVMARLSLSTISSRFSGWTFSFFDTALIRLVARTPAHGGRWESRGSVNPSPTTLWSTSVGHMKYTISLN